MGEGRGERGAPKHAPRPRPLCKQAAAPYAEADGRAVARRDGKTWPVQLARSQERGGAGGRRGSDENSDWRARANGR